MSRKSVPLTGRERFFADDEIIVSKTDLKGRITYANTVFLRIAGYAEHEVIGAPHSLIRHPDMPRAVFKVLWDVIGTGKEIFAYVKNLSKNGDHYWVIAHVTPTFDAAGRIIGYHSNRRPPNRKALEVIEPLYARIRKIETDSADAKAGMAAAHAALIAAIGETGMGYDELMFTLEGS
ncbi:PAS domain-containing protein [Novispirillum sp. DQ9]|uniref:PAS domain-containing protein n=1 Tax=Novispirillum sp. DQ9 TaxID=3398612 RepID=UPI003C7BD393